MIKSEQQRDGLPRRVDGCKTRARRSARHVVSFLLKMQRSDQIQFSIRNLCSNYVTETSGAARSLSNYS